jgi:hypothetical protein
MKTFKGIVLFLSAAAIGLSGCASSIRFTHEEIKSYPLDVQERIIKGEVAAGMTQQQVRYAWGAPDVVTTLEPISGRHREEWIYNQALGYKKRLLFLDGKVSDISEGLFLKSDKARTEQEVKQETKQDTKQGTK